MICQFCGGKSCKHEDWTKCESPAIKGLHSNWINDKIIASQRLSDRLIDKYKIIDQFKEHNVKAIFNLQEPGEHPYWGDGLVSLKIGFSYTPEKLQKEGISFYNFHWEDLTNPKISEVLKNVKLMDMHISKGEAVLVHCHAGQGRTALIIAAYLMYKNITTSVDDTIRYIRSQRHKCLKKAYNQKFLLEIAQEFLTFRKTFPVKGEHFRSNIEDIIRNQLKYFHGDERIKYRNIPKVIDLCLVKLYQLIESGHYEREEILDSFLLIDDLKKSFDEEDSLSKIKESINEGKWELFIEYTSKPKVIAQLFLDFCESLSSQIINIKGLQEVDNTFKKSFSVYSNSEENKDKKALHEIFEDNVKVNPKKVIFTIICKLLGFLRVFNDWDNQDLLIDRVLVALMQKKNKLRLACFAGRAMISSASDEDKEVKLLADIFRSILNHDDFIEFNSSPLPRKKKHIRDMHALSVKTGQESFSLNATEKRVQNFIQNISLMEDQDQEFFLTKLDKITKDAENHYQSVANSPVLLPRIEKRTEQGTGAAFDGLVIRLNKVDSDATNKSAEDENPVSNDNEDSEDLENCERKPSSKA